MIEYLYHGTSTAVLDKIMTEGIRPRKHTKMTNWKMSVESEPNSVYLSRALAPYFAMVAADSYGGQPVVLEVATSLLDPDLLMPDEDALEQGSRGLRPGQLLYNPSTNMTARTLWYRKNAPRFAAAIPRLWMRSVEVIGNCCYRGTIPSIAITGKRIFETTGAVLLEWGDPTISIIAYAVVGARYRVMTDQMFGRMSSLEDLRDYHNHNAIIERMRQSHEARRLRQKA